MRIAITGGSGRLGRYVRRALVDHELRLLDRLPPADPVADFRQVDVLDLDDLTRALDRIEVVVHLAAIDRSVATDDALTMQVNAMGTWTLFEASRRAGVRRVIHCSSSSATEIGATNPTAPPQYLPIDEAHAAHPTDAYGLSKLCSERIAEAFARRGLEVLTLRPCFVAFPDLRDFMAGRPGPADREEPMPSLRAYVDPVDCARGFALAVMLVDYVGYETFFLAADDAFSNQPTIMRLQDLYDAPIQVREPALYERSPHASPVSNARARMRLGWLPTTRWTGTSVTAS